MTPFVLLVALSAPVPNIDLETICRSAVVNALPEDRPKAHDSCVADEKAAQEAVKTKWMTVTPEGRADCGPMEGIPASYVEMLTCLDMQSGGEFDPQKGAAVKPGDRPSMLAHHHFRGALQLHGRSLLSRPARFVGLTS